MSDQRLRDLERKHRESPDDEGLGQELFRERLRGIDLAELVLRRLARMERLMDRVPPARYRGEVSYQELNELLERGLDDPDGYHSPRGGGGMGSGGGVAVLEVQGEVTIAADGTNGFENGGLVTAIGGTGGTGGDGEVSAFEQARWSMSPPRCAACAGSGRVYHVPSQREIRCPNCT